MHIFGYSTTLHLLVATFSFTPSGAREPSGAFGVCNPARKPAVTAVTNASDHIVIDNPYITPDGVFQNGSGRWTWSLDTQTTFPQDNRGNTSVRQTLRLKTEPHAALSSQFRYIGCGLIIHGIAYDKLVSGQENLPSDCNGFLSDDCRQILLEETEYRASAHGFSFPELGSELDDACRDLGHLRDGDPISQCESDFAQGVWFEPFLWASHVLNDPNCKLTNSSDGSYVVRSWGSSTNPPTDLYNNLTTLIEPIIATLLLRHPLSNDEMWAKSHIMCLRTGKNVAEGSAPAPSQVPRSVSPRTQQSNAVLFPLLVGLLLFGIF